MLKVYGLTGGIACGKSTVAQVFRELGAVVIDADQIHHKLCEKGEIGWQRIKEVFGDAVFNADGSLNREKLGEIVFHDPSKRRRLEEISHPLIMEQIHEEVRSYVGKNIPFILVEAALLIESNRVKQFHGLVVVSCREEQQIERLMRMRGISREKALSMVQAQLPIEEKVKRATYVIDNSGDWVKTNEQVKKVFEEIKKRKDERLSLWE